MNHSLSRLFASLMKVPFYVYFGHFWAIFGTFLNLSVSRIPCLLNWITSELNQQNFSESNNILNWVKQYWIKYWMNHFWQSSRIESNQVGYRTPLRQLNMWLCHWVSESAFDCLDFVLATMTPVCTALHCTANTSMHCKYQLTLEFISRY